METLPPAGAPPGHGPVPAWVKGLVAAGLLCYGVSSPLVRLAGDTPALAIAAWRCLMVTVLLAPLALRRERATFATMPAREWLLILGAGVALGVHFVGWILSVQLTTIAAASVLVSTTPLWIALLGVVTQRERPDPPAAVALVAGVVGAALIGVGSAGEGVAVNAALGNALALGAAVLVSVYLLAGRAVRQRRSFLAYFAPVNAVATVLALAACLVMDVSLALPAPTLALIGVMALGPGLLGHGSFATALRWVPAATLGLLSLAEPVLASGIAAVAFGEVPSALSVVGMGVVLVAIAVVLRRG